MKILILTHGFPPHQTAGTESYAASLATALARRGHDVRVFTAHKDISRKDYQLARRSFEGVVVHELVQNLFHDDFAETYDNPRVESAFASVLDEFAPDVVHVQHLLYLSGGCLPMARARGAVVLFTLHDFWLECPRFGQRVHVDGGLCERIEFARCGSCLSQFKYNNSGLERTVGSVLAGLRSGTGIDLGPLARGAAAKLGAVGAGGAGGVGDASARKPQADMAAVELFTRLAEERTRHLQRIIVPCVDLFLAPSRFLRERFISEWGIPPARIEHLRFGIDVDTFRPGVRVRSDRLRVRFLGSLVPLKGPHLLLEAWSRLSPALRARGELVLYGSSRHHPDYQASLAASASACGALLGGHLDRAGVARVLLATDLLVVPSLWFENSPLVILEALAAQTPLLVSNLGGMAELVEEGVSGFHFRVGDVEHLRAQLALALEGRLGFENLDARPPELPRFEDHVAIIEARYRALSTPGGARG